MAEAAPFWIAMQSRGLALAAENGVAAAIAGPGGLRSVSPLSEGRGRGSQVNGCNPFLHERLHLLTLADDRLQERRHIDRRE